jgi:hypothetical protein
MDRLAGANARYNITYTGGGTGLNSPFDASNDSAAFLAAGVTQVWEIDFGPYRPWTANTASGFTFERGKIVMQLPYGLIPANFKVEVYRRDGAGIDNWVTRVDKSSGFAPYTAVQESLAQDNWLKKMRISVTAGGTDLYVSGLEYFPEAPDAQEESYTLGTCTGRGSQRCYTPIEIQNAGGTSRLTLGQGTIQINGGGKLNGIESITTTIASPGSGWSFAWAKALVGDMIQIIPKNGSSAGVVGRCSTAGTVLADTTSITNGTSIELRILRTIA